MIGSTVKGYRNGRWDIVICFEKEGRRGILYSFPRDGEPSGGFFWEDDWEVYEDDPEMEDYLGSTNFNKIWETYVHG